MEVTTELVAQGDDDLRERIAEARRAYRELAARVAAGDAAAKREMPPLFARIREAEEAFEHEREVQRAAECLERQRARAANSKALREARRQVSVGLDRYTAAGAKVSDLVKQLGETFAALEAERRDILTAAHGLPERDRIAGQLPDRLRFLVLGELGMTSEALADTDIGNATWATRADSRAGFPASVEAITSAQARRAASVLQTEEVAA